MTDGERKSARRWSQVVHSRKVRRWLAIAVAVVVVYGLLGFFAAPPLLRSELASKLTQALHRRTTVESVSVNPFVLSVRVRGLTVRKRGSETAFVSLGDLYANFKVTSIFRWAPVVQELRLDGFSVHLVHNPDGSYNFSDLIAPAPAPSPGQEQKPLRYALNNIQLSGGSIDFDDRPVGKVHTVRNLYLAIPFFSNLPDETNVFVQPALRAVVNGRSVALEGRTKPFSSSLDTSLEIDLKDIDIPTYLAYLPSPLRVKVRSALLSTTLSLTFRQERGKPSTLLLSGRAALANVSVEDQQGGELLTLPLLDVRIAEANLLTGRTSLERVLFQQPRLWVARDAAGRWNLAALSQTPSGEGTASTDKGKALALAIGSLQVTDGSVQFSDAGVAPPFAGTASSIEIGVRGFDTAPGKSAAVELSFATDAGETLRESGQLTWSPLAAHGTIEAVGMPLRRYQAYAAHAIAFDIADGVLGLSTSFGWDGSGAGWSFSGLGATLRSLRLRRPGEKSDFLTIPETVLEGSALDIPRGRFDVGGLTVKGARLAVARGGNGVWNLATLLAPAPATPEEGAEAAPATTPVAQEGASPAWTITLGRVALERATVELDDALPSHPVRLKLAPLAVMARGLSTAPGVQGRLQLRCGVGGTGKVSLAGDVGLEPLTAKLKTEVKSVPLVPLQGYVEDRLHLVVNDGAASATGTLTVASDSVGFTGGSSVDQLATVDADAAEDLLRWDKLAFNGVSFASQPFHLGIDQIVLAGLSTDITVAKDGTMNLKRVLGGAPAEPADEGEREQQAPEATPEPVPTPAPAPTAAAEATTPAAATAEAGPESAVRIDAVKLENAAIVFADHSVSPEFRMTVTKFGGTVSGLSSLASSAADVDLHATLNDQTPLSVTGKVNPLAGNLFLDLKVTSHGLDLPPLSPYSGTYAGYTIERGKLDADLTYKVEKRRLQADNKLLLDQFDFGDKVESPKATHLPVRFAVSLLKDREGRIKLNLPVSGSLDDPQFRVGRIVLKMVINLIAKAATSPFALLGAIFGGGHAHLDTVAFAPGTTTLDEAARNSLDTLAKMLYERPGLRLDITGRIDEAADREGLRKLRLERAVKREKLNEIVKKGGTVPSLDAVTIEPAEYDKYLERAYKHGKFSKPRNFLGIAKKEPPEEMKRVLLASFEPSSDDLRQLAEERARAVQSYLVQTGKVTADRLFIVAASAAPSAGKKKGPGTRVDLSLK